MKSIIHQHSKNSFKAVSKTLIIALVLGFGVSGFAQVATPQPTKAKTEKMTPEQRQKKHLAKLTKELHLDGNQQIAVAKLLSDRHNSMKDIKSQKKATKTAGEKMTIEEKEALRTKMETEKLNTESKMKAILSADQYTKWQTMRDENKAKMMEKKKAKM